MVTQVPEVIDLDKIGAARREALKDRPIVKFGGEEFQLPAEMPFAVIEAVGRLQPEEGEEVDNTVLAAGMADIARALFGAKYRKFLDLGPSTEDLTSLLSHIAPAYGLGTTEGGAEAATPAEPEPDLPDPQMAAVAGDPGPIETEDGK